MWVFSDIIGKFPLKAISLCLFMVMFFSLCKSEEKNRMAELYSHLNLELPDYSFKVRRKPESFSICNYSWDSCVEDGAGPEVEGSSDETEVAKSWLLEVCLKMPCIPCQGEASLCIVAVQVLSL